MSLVAIIILLLIIGKWGVQWGLEKLNQRHVQSHASAVPAASQGVMSPAGYAKSIGYTLAKSRLAQWESFFHSLLLLVVLFSGLLPWLYRAVTSALGTSIWAASAYLFLIGFILSLAGLPLDYYHQFQLEARFDFNHATRKTWCLDQLKGWLLALILGYPLAALILTLAQRAGAVWWLWAWACVVGFQLVVSLLAPVFIMPLFNKFTPLPEGELRAHLIGLAQRTGFHAQSIQVMDGSRRSAHSNAFFTGFGRFRKIILFDTLIEQLTMPELVAVLAHEIGHYRKKHVVKMLLGTILSLFVSFFLLGFLTAAPWFLEAFGFVPGNLAAALLVCSLLTGTVTYWLEPVANRWLRRHEFEADRFAAEAVGEPELLIHALRKLTEKNLGNLTPHPWYSAFYYSHPTLLEREQALLRFGEFARAEALERGLETRLRP